MRTRTHPAADADRIVDLYERHASEFDADRDRSLTVERGWLDRWTALLPEGATILDLGCGSGEPIARYLVERGFRVMGIDSSPTLVSLCDERFPSLEWRVADMRTLHLGRTFDGILAWDSVFHLSPDDQRRVFAVFERHTAPGAALLFTSGPTHGIRVGSYRGEPLYHASLSESEYRSLLSAHGFSVRAHTADDATAGDHTVWLAARISHGATPGQRD